MPTAPQHRIRLGLGIVVITIFACFAVEILALVLKGPTKDAIQALSPVGLVAIFATTVGWWLFASSDPDIPDAPAVRLWLRIAACSTLIIQAAILLGPTLPFIGVVTWLPGGALFYFSLIRLRGLAIATGDLRLASHSFWCMIFVPVLFLGGVALMMGILLTMTLEMSSSLAAIDGGNAPPSSPTVPHLPSGAIFLPMIPMMTATLWYVSILTAAWLRFGRRARPMQYAPAY